MDAPGWVGIEAVRTDIRNIMTAQEAYCHRHGAYAPDLAVLTPEYSGNLLGSQAETQGGEDGFVVIAWNDTLKPGPSRCTVYVGKVAEKAGVASGLMVTT